MLHLAIALAGHPLSGIQTVWLGDEPISSYPEHAFFELHTNRQVADPYMLENCPSWKEDMIGKGITWLRVSLKFNAENSRLVSPTLKSKSWVALYTTHEPGRRHTATMLRWSFWIITATI